MLARRDLLVLGAALAAPGPASAQPGGHIHALLVGINSYRIKPLRGCLNDVRLIEEGLRALRATVTTLVEAQATRGAFLACWEGVTARAGSGDTLILHFAGHGALDPRVRAGARPESGGNFLLFRDYDPKAWPGEMLVDTELHALLVPLHRRGIQPIVLLDCCYAGALTRGIDRRAAGADVYRTADLSMADVAAAMASQPPPPPPPPPAELAPVLFLAAGQATEAVPEILTPDGAFHGALSLGFARAIGGEAHTSRAGVLTRGELFNHILIVSQALAESRQHPVMRPGDRLDEPILPVLHSAPAIPAPSGVPRADSPVRLSILNMPSREAEAAIAAIPGGVAAGSPDGWDLLWDAQTREAFGPGRDLLARHTTQAILAALVQRIRAQRRLAELSAVSGLDVRLVWPGAATPAENDASHPRGRRLNLRVPDLRLPFLIVFSLSGEGTVQYLHPGPKSPDQQPIGSGNNVSLPGFCVTEPFGSDIAVALAADRKLPSLTETLRRLNNQPAVPEVIATLEAALAGAEWQIGMHTVVTREAQGEEQECRG